MPNSILQSFQKHAAIHSTCLAIDDRESRITYLGLDSQSSLLAESFIAHGIQPNSLIALIGNSLTDFVTMMLAAWKCNCAYVAVSPTSPATQRRYISSISAATVDTNGTVSFNDERATEILPAGTAYVIFTSGSTGNPKGIAIGHEGLSRLAAWRARFASLQPGDRVGQVADLAFDASVYEIWPALAYGCTLVPTTMHSILEPTEHKQYLCENRIKDAFVPTALAPGLFDQSWDGNFSPSTLLSGGDTLRAWPTESLPFVFANGYGPAEGTVMSTVAVLDRYSHKQRLPPIGRPLPHISYKIVPESTYFGSNARGELLIGGANVAFGYINADNSAFKEVAGTRWFGTGDIVEEIEGDLYFIGRRDNQIKVAGRRVEINGIVTALCALPNVYDAVVLQATENTHGLPIGAVLAMESHETFDRRYIQKSLASILPLHEVPSLLIRVATIPMTNNGKYDLDKCRELLREHHSGF
ncbi:AMP-binding protein [Brevibacterium sediminis]|uniref:AMP-binding protein n=1 Tax=Brevibacterium sediminis TaxID=1857024 RepID=UPI0021750780|nr:AMP-binding protein [Brevibacterium sediminis]MCS4592677.1 AMP-binding protein [Brevibacterium sediminis]